MDIPKAETVPAAILPEPYELDMLTDAQGKDDESYVLIPLKNLVRDQRDLEIVNQNLGEGENDPLYVMLPFTELARKVQSTKVDSTRRDASAKRSRVRRRRNKINNSNFVDVGKVQVTVANDTKQDASTKDDTVGRGHNEVNYTNFTRIYKVQSTDVDGAGRYAPAKSSSRVNDSTFTNVSKVQLTDVDGPSRKESTDANRLRCRQNEVNNSDLANICKVWSTVVVDRGRRGTLEKSHHAVLHRENEFNRSNFANIGKMESGRGILARDIRVRRGQNKARKIRRKKREKLFDMPLDFLIHKKMVTHRPFGSIAAAHVRLSSPDAEGNGDNFWGNPLVKYDDYLRQFHPLRFQKHVKKSAELPVGKQSETQSTQDLARSLKAKDKTAAPKGKGGCSSPINITMFISNLIPPCDVDQTKITNCGRLYKNGCLKFSLQLDKPLCPPPACPCPEETCDDCCCDDTCGLPCNKADHKVGSHIASGTAGASNKMSADENAVNMAKDILAAAIQSAATAKATPGAPTMAPCPRVMATPAVQVPIESIHMPQPSAVDPLMLANPQVSATLLQFLGLDKRPGNRRTGPVPPQTIIVDNDDLMREIRRLANLNQVYATRSPIAPSQPIVGPLGQKSKSLADALALLSKFSSSLRQPRNSKNINIKY